MCTGYVQCIRRIGECDLWSITPRLQPYLRSGADGDVIERPRLENNRGEAKEGQRRQDGQRVGKQRVEPPEDRVHGGQPPVSRDA